jgi:hypothetical protein
MKKLILAILATVLLVAGCGGQQRLTAWALTAPDSDLTVMVGAEKLNAEGNGATEVGFVAKYAVASDIPWGPQPDQVGAYVNFWLSQLLSIEDLPAASPLKNLIEALHAQPFAGAELVVDVDGEGRKVGVNWQVGTLFTLDPLSDFGLAVLYLDGEREENGVFIGGRGRFFQF